MLLSTYGSRGDVEPMVALAVRLRVLGAEVRICAPPDEEYRQLLARADVPVVPVGRSWRLLARPSSARSASRLLAELLAEQFDPLVAAAEGADLLVAAGMSLFVAPTVAEKLGIRYAYAAFCPIVLPSPHHPPPPWGRPFPPGVTDNRVLWDLEAQNYNALFGEPINTHRASVGLPPLENVREFVLTDRPLLAADPTLGPWRTTADLDVAQTGGWVLPDQRPLPSALTAFLDAGTPPVHVGFGSMRVAKDLGWAASAAIRARGRRGLLGRGWADLTLVDKRDDCFVVGEVNQQELFGRVAAVVHHGGAGTTTAAALAGAPQVVIPQATEQPYWADRVATLGIGTALAGPTPTTEAPSAALKTTLTPAVRARAEAVAGMIRTDGVTVAAKLLLDALD